MFYSTGGLNCNLYLNVVHFFSTFWNFYEIFVTVVKMSHRKTSWPPSMKCSPLLKSPAFITLQISFTFNQALIFCINVVYETVERIKYLMKDS